MRSSQGWGNKSLGAVAYKTAFLISGGSLLQGLEMQNCLHPYSMVKTRNWDGLVHGLRQ